MLQAREFFLVFKEFSRDCPIKKFNDVPFLGGKEDVARLEVPVDHRAPHVVKKTHTLNYYKTVDKSQIQRKIQ
jgi:hypothetical protein